MTELALLSFEQLLERYFADPLAEMELVRRYGARAGILVVDLTRMTRRTDEHGIAYALAVAHAAARAMAPAIAAHGGNVVKQVADTAFAAFPTPADVLGAALDAQRAMKGFAPGGGDHVHACMGLGYGDVLLVPGADVFGAEVNRAFVLGEDVAHGGEVLATRAFLDALGGLPDGVGAFEAPEDRATEAGFPFHVLRDYRE